MVEVEMTKDIRDFEPHFLGPLTKRQIIYIGISAAYGIPFMVLAPIESVPNRLFIGIMLMLPVFMCGFVKWDGLPMEVLMIKLLYRLICPTKRKMSEKNYWRSTLEEIELKQRLEEFNKLSKKEQKKAMKQQKVSIQYSKNPELKGYR